MSGGGQMFGHLLDARTPHLGPHDLELESQPRCAMRHFRCGHANSVFCDLIYKISLLWSSVVGDRSFSAAGLRLWNDLPPGLRRPGLTFDSSRQSLETHLFGDRSA